MVTTTHAYFSLTFCVHPGFPQLSLSYLHLGIQADGAAPIQDVPGQEGRGEREDDKAQ